MVLKFPLSQLYICKLGSSCVAPRRAAPFALRSLRSFASRLARSCLANCGRWLRLFVLFGLSPPGTPSRVGVSVLWWGCALPLAGFRPWYASRAPRFTDISEVFGYLSVSLLLATLVAVTIIIDSMTTLTRFNFVTICQCLILFRLFFVLCSFPLCYYLCSGNIAIQL